MTRDPKTCGPDASLADAIAIMREENCGIVPVTEGNGEARVVGVVTDRDVALILGERDARPSGIRVSEAMSTNVVTVRPDEELSDVTRKMEDAQVRRVLVCENGQLLGVVATADLAREAKAKETGRVIGKISQPEGSH
jgi:CBS domain-containing protein